MSEQRWYWGAVIRVDDAEPLLAQISTRVDGERVRAQNPQTGHITLFYAPLRGSDGAGVLADRIRADMAQIPAFDLQCTGFDEFASDVRPVAWLGVTAGHEPMAQLRSALCACDEDCHRHAFIPHLTLAYGEDPAAYGAVRGDIRNVAEHAVIATHVDAIWIAGFPADGHPARDLRYVEQIPLARG